MITFDVEDQQSRQTIEIPEDINLNLMEVLRAAGYPIAATCGGMALCATCHVEVTDGFDKLSERTEQELDMLDTLPSTTPCSRLACQVKVNDTLQDARIRLNGGT
jgi:2Fe-2S ferredoxin